MRLNFKVIVDGVSEVNEVDANNFGICIYPNPATDIVTVKNVAAKTTITILDLSGRALQNFKSADVTGDAKISVSHLHTGVYFVKIENKETHMIKLLKK